jgi:hypothetical protein
MMTISNKSILELKSSQNFLLLLIFTITILNPVHLTTIPTELRLLSEEDKNKITTNIPVIIFPKCLSNRNCSDNGICNRTTGKCECNLGYDTFLGKDIIKEKTQKAFSTKENTTTPNSEDASLVEVYKIKLTTEDMKFCNYKLKNQLTAFMLSMFVGFGSEHFYLERNSTGAAKFVFYIFCFALNIVMFIIYKCIPNGKTFVHHLSVYDVTYLGCGFVFIILWNIYDWVHIGYDTFLDGNGFKMIPWN